ncbi:MAG: response regulator [Lachnospiraceae bacterium]|nr:response regulator [Lachnospiraceae bacterium]
MNIAADNKNEKHAGKVILAVKILFFLVIALSAAGLWYFSSIDHSDPREYTDPVFIEKWSVTMPDGSVVEAGSSFRNDGKRMGDFTVESTLPETVSDDSCLCFIIGGDVAVYVDGELRKDFVAARDMVIPGGCVKRFFMHVPLKAEDAGKEVKLIRKSTTKSGFVYQQTLVADDASFMGFMYSKYGASFLLSLLLALFSAIIVVVSIIMMLVYRRRIEMLYGSLSVFIIAGWLITNSFLYPFIFGHYHIDGVINYILCLMMPFSLAFYIDALQHGRYRIYTGTVLCLASVNLVGWPILHFTGVFPFPNALIFIDAFLAAELLIVAGTLATDLIRGYMREYRYTAIGISGFMICGVGEIVVLNFLPIINGDILMLSGLGFMLALSVVQQIADLMKASEEGKRAIDLSEAKTRFLANMSHEIRTPINAILGMNEMILRENKDPAIDEYAESVRSSGQMLLMLVNDVLDFSRIEAGRMEISEAEFSFSSMLRSIMPIIRERAYEKDLKLQTVIQGEVPDGMISDEFRIRQILINIMSNAVKYTDTGTVSLILDGGYTGDDVYRLRMSVRDTGRGIKEEDQKHLFEAFARADEKKNRSIEGTGLGLAIVKRILDSMGGEISVVSKYGEGSEFTVCLPVKVIDRTPVSDDSERRTESSAADENASAYRAPEAAVLAVDDNNSNLKIVKLFLKHVGIVPELCDSGKEAVELCRQKRYDLILLDHMMPDPDGIKTLGLIRSDMESKNRETPVIVLTANALAGSAKLYADAGFADYLTKPLDSALLERTVRKYLPEDKILTAAEETSAPEQAPSEDTSSTVEETSAPEQTPSEETSPAGGTFEPMSFREKLEMIEGLDYEAALGYAGGDEELLKEMVDIVSSECDEKIERMRASIASKDWNGYGITAHSVKGVMASLGLAELSARARKHEYAAKNSETDFIESDCEGFFEAYRDVCVRMR